MNKNLNNIKSISVDEIKELLDENIINNDEAKLSLSTALYKQYNNISDNNVLLMGPKGCGKTAIATELLINSKLPFYITNANKFGLNTKFLINDMLKNLYLAAGKNIEKAEHGIIFINHIDTILSKKYIFDNDSINKTLKDLFNGTSVYVKISKNEKVLIDTTNILFIVAGTFSNAFKNTKNRLGENALTDKLRLYTFIEEEDLVSFGMHMDLIHSFNSLIPMIDYTTKDIIKLLQMQR